MKKLYTLLLIAVSTLSFGQVFFTENMGTPSSTTAIAANTFQNGTPIAFSGTADVRASSISTGYSGASGGGNVYFASNTTNSFLIEGINTTAYNTSDIQLSFGHHKSTTAANNELIVEVSTDGTTFSSPLTYSRATGSGTSNWTLITITSGIPSTSNLRIRFRQTSTTSQFRIDDVKLNAVSASCTLTLGATTSACLATTSNLDNYTVTIPYTGGANATYTITTSGTVSGDNPTSAAAGNIVVTFTEGTAYSVNITGGTCNLNVTGASPECKVTNTLPFSEPFNYTAGTPLSNSQKWTNTSVGSDEILAIATNLSYTGITSTGGSVAFVGTGSDTKTPFTTINSDVIYTSFLTSVTDLTGVTGTSYFAIMSDAANSFTTIRIWIKNNGTEYQFGLSPTTNAADIVWSSNLYAINSTQYLVLRYNFTSNTCSLFENPTIGGTASSTVNVTPGTAISNLAGFVLRQDSATNTPAMVIDELTIDTVPNFTLSSSSFNAIEGLTMYPNPLSGNTLYLTSNANAAMSVQIFDLVGKEVVKADVVNNSVNVANLTAGVYVVKITEEGKTATRKLVIQ